MRYSSLFQLADELWPEESPVPGMASDLSLEAQIADEMSSLKKPRKEKRFGSDILHHFFLLNVRLTSSHIASCQTNTPCGKELVPIRISIGPFTSCFLVVFISCKPPVDPVQLVVKHVENVQRTGLTRTR